MNTDRAIHLAVIGMLCFVLSSAAHGQQNQPSLVQLDVEVLRERLTDLQDFRVAKERIQRIESLYIRILDRLGVEDSRRLQSEQAEIERLLNVPAKSQLIEAGFAPLLLRAARQWIAYASTGYTVARLDDLARGLWAWFTSPEPIEAIQDALGRIENEVDTIEASLGKIEIALTDILAQLDHILQ